MIEILCWMALGAACVEVGDWVYGHIKKPKTCEHDYEETDIKTVSVTYKSCRKCGCTAITMNVPSEDFKATLEGLRETHDRG